VVQRIKLLIVVLALTLGVAVTFSIPAQAQSPHRITKNELKNLLARIEQTAERFRGSLDSALDRSEINGSRAEDEINNYLKGFEKATDHLESRFSENNSAASDVEAVLQRAGEIDRFMSRHNLAVRAQEDWALMRGHLDQLAAAYNVDWGWSGLSSSPERASEKSVKDLLGRLENDADSFRSSLASALDRSRFDDSKTEDNINRFNKDFENATDRLKERFGDKRSAAGIVREILGHGALINSFVSRNVANERAREDWLAVRGDLDELARIYAVAWEWEVMSSR
jgi:hypothetical protein